MRQEKPDLYSRRKSWQKEEMTEEEKKRIHMDVVVDFEEKDRDGLIAGIQKELEEKFPGYQFLITRDLDISD